MRRFTKMAYLWNPKHPCHFSSHEKIGVRKAKAKKINVAKQKNVEEKSK